MLIWAWCFLAAYALANTETYLLQIPKYFNTRLHELSPEPLLQLNSSHWLLSNHPIHNISTYTTQDAVVDLPYDFTAKLSQTLLVRLTNLGDTYQPEDLINVKLCWPATIPVGFSISHRFLAPSELNIGALPDPLAMDVFVVVDIVADFYAVREVELESVQFQLMLSKISSHIPIPIELYDFILYAVDLMILVAAFLPHILNGLKHML